MDTINVVASIASGLVGAGLGVVGWHGYYLNWLPSVVKKVGYSKRVKTRRTRKPKDATPA